MIHNLNQHVLGGSATLVRVLSAGTLFRKIACDLGFEAYEAFERRQTNHQ